ncbi:MAG: L,D-transpeptidase, partial [Deltaproteobacteria bacterium]|nr:L,D-transpeptidase [Deltaproteobacteria bacterium]
VVMLASCLWGRPASAKDLRYWESQCEDPRFTCREIQEGETWKGLWPDDKQRDLVMRLNRMNVRLRPGMVVAVPNRIDALTRADISPFPNKIPPPGEKQIQVDLTQLAWGAYDAEGNLLEWGPASGGKDWCPDTGHACKTPSGDFSVVRKSGAHCKSNKFPIPRGGAPMPYCMFFLSDYAVHGSYEVPGYRASHGCVRIYPEDAQWLNENFVDLPDSSQGVHGTSVIVQPY